MAHQAPELERTFFGGSTSPDPPPAPAAVSTLESLTELFHEANENIIGPVTSAVRGAASSVAVAASGGVSSALIWIKDGDVRYGAEVHPCGRGDAVASDGQLGGGGGASSLTPREHDLASSSSSRPSWMSYSDEEPPSPPRDLAHLHPDALPPLPPKLREAADAIASFSSGALGAIRSVPSMLREGDATAAVRAADIAGRRVPVPDFASEALSEHLGLAGVDSVAVSDIFVVLAAMASAVVAILAAKFALESRRHRKLYGQRSWRPGRVSMQREGAQHDLEYETTMALNARKKAARGLVIDTSEEGTAPSGIFGRLRRGITGGAAAAAAVEEDHTDDAEEVGGNGKKHENNRPEGPAPLKLLGPTVTSLEYIATAPPPPHPAVFASSKYRSIRRKLVVDVRHLTLSRCAPRDHPVVEKKRRRARTGSADGGTGGGLSEQNWADEPLTHVMLGFNSTVRVNDQAPTPNTARSARGAAGSVVTGITNTTRSKGRDGLGSTSDHRPDPYRAGPALSNFIDAGTGTRLGTTFVPGGAQASIATKTALAASESLHLRSIANGAGQLDMGGVEVGVGSPARSGTSDRSSGGGGNPQEDLDGGVSEPGSQEEEEDDDDAIESALPPASQTFHPDPHPLPIKSVLNATAVPPRAGGVLELTLSENHRRAYDSDNTFLIDVALGDETTMATGLITDPLKLNEKKRRGTVVERQVRDDAQRASAWMDGGAGNVNHRKYGDGLTVRDSAAAAAVGLDAILSELDTAADTKGGDDASSKNSKKSKNILGGGGKKNKNDAKEEETTPEPIRTVAEEYTFESCSEAADFQGAVLALRVAGKEIRNMYCALELLHMSSEAYCENDDAAWLRDPERVVAAAASKEGDGDGDGKDGKEKQDGGGTARMRRRRKNRDYSTDNLLANRGRPPAGVALDDVVRCLGEVPQVRRILDRYVAHHYPHLGRRGAVERPEDLNAKVDDDDDDEDERLELLAAAEAKKGGGGDKEDGDGGDDGCRSDEAVAACYKKTRLLLGYIDFLRLFVPPVTGDSGPESVPYSNPTAAKTKKRPRRRRPGDEADDSDDEDEDGGIDAHKSRIVSVMRLRKLAGRCALRVRWYVTGTYVAREGWTVPPPPDDLAARCTALEQRAIADIVDEKLRAKIKAEEERRNPPKQTQAAAVSAMTTKRLAYDDDRANIQRDMGARNEYYEAMVGRSVQCAVRSRWHRTPTGGSALAATASLAKSGKGLSPLAASAMTTQPSGRQAYALVGMHTFRLPRVRNSESDKVHPLQSTRDPVSALPSLRKVIESHPEQQFFVSAFFPENLRQVMIFLFVRTLPPGIDARFDATHDAFWNGDAEVRDKKLEVFSQLGPGDNLTLMTWATLRVILAMARWRGKRGEVDALRAERRGVRTFLPGMTISRYSRTRHFGGKGVSPKGGSNDDMGAAIGADSSSPPATSLPKNYVAVTSHIDASANPNVAVRLLYSRLEDGCLPRLSIDFTLVLRGESEEELPERALGTIRMVHVDGVGTALPVAYSAARGTTTGASAGVGDGRPGLGFPALSTSGISTLSGGSDVFVSARAMDPTSGGRILSGPGAAGNAEGAAAVEDAENLDILMEILDGVTVPVRRENEDLIPPDILAEASSGGGDNTGGESNVATPKTGNRVSTAAAASHPTAPTALATVSENSPAGPATQSGTPADVATRPYHPPAEGPMTQTGTPAKMGQRSYHPPQGPATASGTPATAIARPRHPPEGPPALRGATPSKKSTTNNNAAADADAANNKPHYETLDVPVLRIIAPARSDLRRYYVASDRDLRTAAVRIVDSAAWRGVTFPVEKRVCRVELQSGQFFRQGKDRLGHPVFYFRNMCAGPWRRDVDATVFSVLHRLEAAMRELAEEGDDEEEGVKCTLIVLMGKPIDYITVEVKEEEEEGAAAAEGEAKEGDAKSDAADGDAGDKKKKVLKKPPPRKKPPKFVRERQRDPFFVGTDPRIDPDEECQIHTNFALVQRLVELVSRHYPERLSRALVVPSGSWIKTVGTFGLRAYVPEARTRAKVTMLNDLRGLKKFVDEEELCAFAGGKALVDPGAFEC